MSPLRTRRLGTPAVAGAVDRVKDREREQSLGSLRPRHGLARGRVPGAHLLLGGTGKGHRARDQDSEAEPSVEPR